VILANSLKRSAWPIDSPIDIPEPTSIAESESAAVAMTLGVRQPLILLPPRHREWHPSKIRAVLLHELAHIRRRDCLLQWLPQAVCALHWFNPLAWFARAQMLCESERACDDAVVRAGTSGPDFARDLLEIAESYGLKGANPMLITVASRLERRITRLLDRSANRQPLAGARTFATLAIALAVLLPLASVRAQNPGTQTGTLAGVVSDPSGAVIANATVNLSGPSGRLAVRVDPAGSWTAKNLAPGRYQVDVAVPGFQVLHDLADVTGGNTTQLRQRLEIGQLAERVTVIGAGTPRTAQANPGPQQRIRVGGNIQAAKLISKTDPVYPDDAREQGLEAAVLIQAVIGKNGTVMNPQVVSASTPPVLAQAALDAVRTWQYEPTKLNGEPVEVLTTITLNFQLR
jgi:TonB family protein